MMNELDHFGGFSIGSGGNNGFGSNLGSLGRHRNQQLDNMFLRLDNMPFMAMNGNELLRRSGMGGFVFHHGMDPDNMTYEQLLQMFPNVPRGANEQDIQALPTDEYKAPAASSTKSNNKDNDDNKDKDKTKNKNKDSNGNNGKVEKCSICLEEFKNGESIRRLPCLHIFHTDEIDRWLRTNHICPICRIPIDERQNQQGQQQQQQ